MNNQQVPDWAATAIGVAILVGAVVLLALAFKAAVAGRWTRKKRVGEAVGRLGGSIFLAVLGAAFAFHLSLSNTLFGIAAGALLLAGIGGTMAGWKRSNF
ncbi:MAG: hypothetical protein AAFP26_00690 [Planctomycetota bacterium]